MINDIVKLTRADTRTGRVLDENYVLQCNVLDSAKSTVETYFSDLESAMRYIDITKELHTNVEFHIYINDKHVHMDVSKSDNATNLYLTPNFQRGRE